MNVDRIRPIPPDEILMEGFLDGFEITPLGVA